MINFRFHIVSLTAVFLALVIGIVMGVAVIDQATVSQLEQGLEEAEARAEKVRSGNDALEAELARWSLFAEQAGDELVAGRLDGVPIVILTVAGAPDDALAALRSTLAAAGADVRGTLELTERVALTEPADVEAMAAVLGGEHGGAQSTRDAAIDRVASEMAAGAAPVVGGLVAERFAVVDGDQNPADLVVPNTRFVVYTQPEAAAADRLFALPLTVALARRADSRVLAVAPSLGPDGQGRSDTPGPSVVGQLRSAGDTRLSTVDNAADFRGRVAAVFALVALGRGVVGDFGFGPGADRVLPDLAL